MGFDSIFENETELPIMALSAIAHNAMGSPPRSIGFQHWGKIKGKSIYLDHFPVWSSIERKNVSTSRTCSALNFSTMYLALGWGQREMWWETDLWKIHLLLARENLIWKSLWWISAGLTQCQPWAAQRLQLLLVLAQLTSLWNPLISIFFQLQFVAQDRDLILQGLSGLCFSQWSTQGLASSLKFGSFPSTKLHVRPPLTSQQITLQIFSIKVWVTLGWFFYVLQTCFAASDPGVLLIFAFLAGW